MSDRLYVRNCETFTIHLLLLNLLFTGHDCSLKLPLKFLFLKDKFQTNSTKQANKQ